MQIDEILTNLAFLDDWEDRYRYVIDLGRALPPLDPSEKTDVNRVRGCTSHVWLVSRVVDSPEGPRLELRGESDAHIVKGLVAILVALYAGKTIPEVLATDPERIFKDVGLREHLSPLRSNGLTAMVERIRRDARAATAAA